MITSAIFSHTPTANALCTPVGPPKGGRCDSEHIHQAAADGPSRVSPLTYTPSRAARSHAVHFGVSCQVLMLQSATKTTQQYNAPDVGGCIAAKTCGFPSHSLLVDSNCMFSHCCSYYLVIGVILNVISVP